jgi:AraC-like DNA-binding protein
MTDAIAVSRTFLVRLTALGIDPQRLLERAGLGASRLVAGSRIRATTREFFAVWRALDALAGPEIGLRIGSAGDVEARDVVSIAAMHAASLGDALAKLARYKRLVCPEEVLIERDCGEVRVQYVWKLAEEAPPPRLVDAVFASAAAIARHGMNDAGFAPLRLELARRKEHEAILARYFGCPIRFGAPRDGLVLSASSLEIPFVTRNAELVEVMTPGLEAALADLSREAPKTIADDVRRVLFEQMRGERPSVDNLARRMHLSSRTLQRRLEEAGTSYQSLLDDVRKQVARRLLATTDLDPGEIAFLLGFEELSSFTRAFHAWEGTTPIRYRASLSRAS